MNVFMSSVLQSAGLQEVTEAVLLLVQSVLGIWLHSSAQDIQVFRISSAMTNMVFSVTLSGAGPSEEDTESATWHPERLLLRVYGNSNWMFQRDLEESTALVLTEHGIIPQWYGVFGNGRFEDYVPSTTVSARDFQSPELRAEISRCLGKIHDMLPKVIEATTWENRDYMLERLESWRLAACLSMSNLLQRNLDSKHAEMLREIEMWNAFSPEFIPKLRCEAARVGSPIVFAHCDLHHGNVLKFHAKDGVIAIDFEYGMPTFRGFDLANFLSEFCYDYNSSTPEVPDWSNYPSNDIISQILQNYFRNNLHEDTHRVIDEINVFATAVQLFWGHWCLIKSVEMVDDGYKGFDYIVAAFERYKRFIQLAEGRVVL
jgi:thiamine kinase-like enzyme